MLLVWAICISSSAGVAKIDASELLLMAALLQLLVGPMIPADCCQHCCCYCCCSDSW